MAKNLKASLSKFKVRVHKEIWYKKIEKKRRDGKSKSRLECLVHLESARRRVIYPGIELEKFQIVLPRDFVQDLDLSQIVGPAWTGMHRARRSPVQFIPLPES